MTRLDNPSGCRSVRHRIYRAPRPTLLQRITRALAAPAAAMVEHLDQLNTIAALSIVALSAQAQHAVTITKVSNDRGTITVRNDMPTVDLDSKGVA